MVIKFLIFFLDDQKLIIVILYLYKSQIHINNNHNKNNFVSLLSCHKLQRGYGIFDIGRNNFPLSQFRSWIYPVLGSFQCSPWLTIVQSQLTKFYQLMKIILDSQTYRVWLETLLPIKCYRFHRNRQNLCLNECSSRISFLSSGINCAIR